jgi:hypothetical protein
LSGRSKDQDLIDDLVAWMQAPDAETAKTNGRAKPGRSPGPGQVPTDEEVISKIRASKNAAKFEDLFDRGDVRAHHGGDDSAADLALLGILRYWTPDEAQLERIFSSSALGRREKWRRRDDYRRRTIHKALAGLGEFYDWTREAGRSRPIGKKIPSSPSSPLIGGDGDDGDGEGPKLELVTFSKRPKPAPREFVVDALIPRHHPTTLYGWGGTAKSLLAVLLGLSVAGGHGEFFGKSINTHGPVLYIDFELDADEQHRRVEQLARGLKMEVPAEFKYVSTLGFRTHDAIEFALGVCEEHGMVMTIIDSLGPAMVGDMAAAKDVIGFHNCYIAPFKGIGVTPVLVDHQARQQAGEGYQNKGAFGSAYKEHLSRSLIQVEAGDRSAEKGSMNVRLRHKKTNFGVLLEPFDVSLSFSDEMIVAAARDLTPADRAGEQTLNSVDRVVAALEDGPAYANEIADATGLALGTVKNAVTALKKAAKVEVTGAKDGNMEQVRLPSSPSRPIKGSDGDDGNSGSVLTPDQVREVLDNPLYFPGALKALEHYRKERTEKALEYLAKSIMHAYALDTNAWRKSVRVVKDLIQDAR